VTFTAAADAESAPIRIVGKALGTKGPPRVARATVAELGRTTEDLWLTVRKTATKK
jgi:hypothetical protein